MSPAIKLRLGTRGSELALVQTKQVTELLAAEHPNLEVETVVIKTRGDRDQTTPLDSLPTTGYFTKELEAALSAGQIDVAVHSLKDLAAKTPEPYRLAAILPRGSARDTLVLHPKYRQLSDLPEAAIVLTGSERRARLLQEILPGCEVRPLRGNIQTRLRKLVDQEADAVVMAEAALQRLGVDQQTVVPLSLEEMVPAPGQGAIALEVLSDRDDLLQLLHPMDSDTTRRATEMERHLSHLLEGGCSIPLGAHAYPEGNKLVFRVAYYPSGQSRFKKGYMQVALAAEPLEVAAVMALQLRGEMTVS